METTFLPFQTFSHFSLLPTLHLSIIFPSHASIHRWFLVAIHHTIIYCPQTRRVRLSTFCITPYCFSGTPDFSNKLEEYGRVFDSKPVTYSLFSYFSFLSQRLSSPVYFWSFFITSTCTILLVFKHTVHYPSSSPPTFFLSSIEPFTLFFSL